MYVPKHYQVDERWSKALIYSHPLAILMTNGVSVPFATHLPVVVPPHVREQFDAGFSLEGQTIFGHLNRANPHWEALQKGGPSTLVFHGKNSYISPTVYEVTPAAPTWNFTAVHLHGNIRVIRERESTLQVIRWTVDAFESEFGKNWDMGPSLGYFDRIVDGVGAFEFDIIGVDAMFKLSQEQPAEVQTRVVRSFGAGSDCPHHAELGQMISQINQVEETGL